MPKPEIHSWQIVGTTPLIQSNPHGMWAEPEEDDAAEAKPMKRKKPMYSGTTEAFRVAQGQLYQENGTHYHPAAGFFDAISLASRHRKLGRMNAIDAVILGVRVVGERFALCEPDTTSPINPKSWMVDKRRAVNHNKGEAQGGVAVVAVRPKWNAWGGVLQLAIDADLFKTLDGLTDLLNIAGVMFGVGVGRRKIKGIRRQQELWSDCGLGRFTAKLIQ